MILAERFPQNGPLHLQANNIPGLAFAQGIVFVHKCLFNMCIHMYVMQLTCA